MMRRAAALLGAFVLVTAPAVGQSQGELQRGLEALEKGQGEILELIEELKEQLQPKPAAPAGPEVEGRVFDLGANPVQGEPAAKLTLVEFTDYQ